MAVKTFVVTSRPTRRGSKKIPAILIVNANDVDQSVYDYPSLKNKCLILIACFIPINDFIFWSHTEFFFNFMRLLHGFYIDKELLQAAEV